MNRFEEMNVIEQQEISGGAIIVPVVPVLPPVVLPVKVAGVVAGAVAGAAVGAMKVLSGKQGEPVELRTKKVMGERQSTAYRKQATAYRKTIVKSGKKEYA